MRVLVTGGRAYGCVPDFLVFGSAEWEHAVARATAESETLRATLAGLPVSLVIHGDASGADKHAGLWAACRGIPEDRYPADWTKHGRAAGPLRNARMIAEGKPDLVVAFPGGRGTADCVRKAKAAGIRVLEVSR